MIKKMQIVRILLGSLFLVLFFHVTTVIVNINRYTILQILADAEQLNIDFTETYSTLNLYNVLFFYIVFIFMVVGVYKWFMFPSEILHFKHRVKTGKQKEHVKDDVRVVDPPSVVEPVVDNSSYDDIAKKVDDIKFMR